MAKRPAKSQRRGGTVKLPNAQQRRAAVQRNARVIAEMYRRRFEAGDDPLALMTAINHCLRYGVVVPPWAAKAFGDGYSAVIGKRAKSWDDVFGRPWPKRMKLAVAQRNDRLRGLIYDVVKWQHPKDPNLFAKVGKQFGIKGSTCRDLYYEADHEMRDLMNAVDTLPP